MDETESELYPEGLELDEMVFLREFTGIVPAAPETYEDGVWVEEEDNEEFLN